MHAHADSFEPVTLEGAYVRLEPLALRHLDALCAVGLDEELWRWTTIQVRSRDEMRAYIEAALHSQRQGSALPFATIDRASGRVVGSTRYGNIEPRDRRLEIGWTWIARSWQRTALNTEAKYLMLRHAFETLGCIRVELKTDALNQRSRQAILRIGAKEEGLLRKHMITAGGRVRDTVYFSVIDTEWPEVKAALLARLSQQGAA
jgi:N-acetyltransferase